MTQMESYLKARGVGDDGIKMELFGTCGVPHNQDAFAAFVLYPGMILCILDVFLGWAHSRSTVR